MKKVTRKVKQALSILLVAAMVITMVPQTTLNVAAQESVETVTETKTVDTTVTDKTDETKPDAGTVDETEDSAEDADAEESEEEEADAETDETDTEDTVDGETEETEDEKSEEGLKKELNDVEPMDASGHTVTVENKESINATVEFTNSCVSGETAIEADTDLTFTVTPVGDYKVTGVKYAVEDTEGDQDPDYDSVNKVYTIAQANITGNVTIKVTTEALANYTVTFDVADGAAVNVIGESAKVITKDSPSNQVVVTENDSISFTVDVESNYTLGTVTATEDTGILTSKDNDGIVTYTFAPTNASTITVTTTPVPKNTVTFTYDENELVVKQVVAESLQDIESKTLTVDQNADFSFAVAAKSTSKYKPTAAVIKDAEDGDVTSKTETKTFDDVSYTVYTVSAKEKNINVTIDKEPAASAEGFKVTFVNSTEHMTYEVTKTEKVTAVDGEPDKYSVAEGAESLDFTITAASTCKEVPVVTNSKEETINPTTKNGIVYTYSVAAKDLAAEETLTITEAQLEAVLIDGEDPVTSAKKYSVAVGDKYTAQLTLGGVAQTLTKVEAKASGTVYEDVAKINGDDSKKADIDVLQAVAGREVTVTLTSEAGEATLVLSVAKAPASVTVAGVKNNVLAQSIGTEKKYKITMTPKDAADTLTVECVSETAGVTAVLADGNLVVTVPANAAVTEKAATITVYDKNDAKKTPLTNGKEITVSTTELLKDVTPTVALKSATDTHLTLALGSKVAAEDLLDSSKLYYKVVVTTENKDISFAANDALYFERTGAAQEAKIQVINGTPGDGSAANFKVEVTLVQTKNGELNKGNEADNTACKSKAVSATAATKAPYFTTKLGSKKLNGGVAYTGQTVQVAQITFDKDATYKGLEVTGYDHNVFSSASIVDGDKLQVTVQTGLKVDELGKKTITVSAINDGKDDNLYVAKTNVSVTVQKGIEKLTVTAPKTVYKQSGKAASFSAGITYNDNDKATTPKKKTVLWSIKAADGESAPDENIAKNVTVKNGKVTINKNFVVSDTESENQFTVVAEAADYAGNNTKAKSGVITVTAEKAELGEVVIIKNNSTGEVIARSGDTVSADKLDGTYAKVLKNGAETKDKYVDADYATAEVVFSSNNKKVLDINAETGKITVLKTGKNLKITATATDGSKAKAELKNLTVGYTEAEELGLEIKQENLGISSIYDGSFACKIGDEDSYKENDVEAIVYYGAVDTTFEINLKQFDAPSEKWNDVRGIADYKLKVAGAKTVYSENGRCIIVAQKNPVTITLTQNASDKAKKKDKTYVLKNLALNTTVSLSAKTRGTLYGGEYPKAQQITCTLSSKGYDFKDKYALVTLNMADAANQKNRERYGTFIFYAPSVGGYIPVNDDGTIDLCFRLEIPGGPPIPDYTVIPVGSYKLNISVGTVNADGKFVADTKTATVTLKAVAQKAVSSKLNAKYTMSTKAGAKAPLTLSNKQTYLTSASLLNANIKGQQNAFKEYFEITGNAEDGFTLKLKDDLNQAQLDKITGKDGKNDLTGWVAYEYFDGTYSYKGETQVTVSFKDAKYSLSKTTVLSDAETATVSLYAGKEKANASTHVLVEGTDFTYNGSAGSKIVLNIPDASKLKKSNKVTLYVVPADSNAVSILDGLKTADNETKTDYENAIKAYGVKLTTTVSVVDKASTTKRISIASKDLTKTFTAKELDVDYEVVDKKGYYIVEVPYTNIVESIDEFTVDAVNDADKAMFKVTVDQENKKLVVKLDKAALAENVKNTGTTGVAYGQSRAVEFTLTVADNAATQKITLNLTLPKEATANYTSVTQAVEEALKDVNTGVYYGGDTGDAVNDNILYIEGLIRDLVPADSDTRLDVESATPPCDPYVTLPTSGKTGSLAISVQLTDLTQDGVYTIKTLHLTLAAL